jgi:hypothetical protein
MFAAKSKEVDAVVPFYGTLRLPPELNRLSIRSMLSVKLKLPFRDITRLKIQVSSNQT